MSLSIKIKLRRVYIYVQEGAVAVDFNQASQLRSEGCNINRNSIQLIWNPQQNQET